MKLKVCGVGREEELELLAGAGVDFAGLWHGIPGGRADLTGARLRRLAAAADASGIRPVVVTFESDPAALARAVRLSGARWVQLHAFQLPKVVVELKRLTGVRVMKVLHVRGRRCLDLPLVAAYQRAGVDAFLLDVATCDGRVGSTGKPLPPDVAAGIADRLERPFGLAGGISACRTGDYEPLRGHAGFAGIDVDTGARDAAGRLHAGRIEAIEAAWRGVPVH